MGRELAWVGVFWMLVLCAALYYAGGARAATIEDIAVSESHPAQELADKVRNHLWKRGYRCATDERQLVVPQWRHIASPAIRSAVAEQRYDGSIIVNRETLRTSKRLRARGGWRYNGNAVDTLIHEYLHLCSPTWGNSLAELDLEEGVVTILAGVETRVFCAHRRRTCTARMPYYPVERAIARRKLGKGIAPLRRWIRSDDDARRKMTA